MSEGRVDDGMIEIDDPTEEPSNAEPEPKVVIQYHERGGVPWMLIPPLLVASAVGAVLLYHKLAPRPGPPRATALARATELPGPDAPVPPTATPPADEVRSVEAPTVAELASPLAGPVPPPSLPVEPMVEPAKVLEPEPQLAPLPRVQGLGFDPKAMEAERRAEAPADPALAAVARDVPPDDRDQPREVDPDLLPPDPLLAKARQAQRRLDALRRVDEERSRFHVELREVCRKFREDSGPEILELRKKYAVKVEPSAEKRAGQLLGKNGKFVGADRRTRIELLRSLGYPEPIILGDLYENYGVKQIGERDGPRSQGEALYVAALFLLRNPPGRDANTSRAVSESTTVPAPSVFGNGAGPAR